MVHVFYFQSIDDIDITLLILDTISHKYTLECRPFPVQRLLDPFQTPKECFSRGKSVRIEHRLNLSI